MPYPVWIYSKHAKKLDPILNSTCHFITGCLTPTNVDSLYILAGIAPPDIRRGGCPDRKKEDKNHMLYGAVSTRQYLINRKHFLKSAVPLNSQSSPETARCKLWESRLAEKQEAVRMGLMPHEELAPGGKLPWLTWRTLNRLRTGFGRCR